MRPTRRSHRSGRHGTVQWVSSRQLRRARRRGYIPKHASRARWRCISSNSAAVHTSGAVPSARARLAFVHACETAVVRVSSRWTQECVCCRSVEGAVRSGWAWHARHASAYTIQTRRARGTRCLYRYVLIAHEQPSESSRQHALNPRTPGSAPRDTAMAMGCHWGTRFPRGTSSCSLRCPAGRSSPAHSGLWPQRGRRKDT